MYRTDQWHDVLHELIVSVKTDPDIAPGRAIFNLEDAIGWRDYVPLGRGLGTYPKIPFHQFRDYRYGSPHIGQRHTSLFFNKKTNSCDLCERSAGNRRRTLLDYFAFYRTGEIFTWADPLFLNGYIHVDPRDPNQSEDSPFTIKWICRSCYTESAEAARLQVLDYATRWSRYKRAILKSPPSRVLVDRRVASSRYSVKFSLHDDPDRRVSLRRHSDVPPLLAERLDAQRVGEFLSNVEQAELRLLNQP